MRVPMKKIICETMMEEMEASGFCYIPERGHTWVKFLDHNKVSQIYHVQFVPLHGETRIRFMISPIIFPYWCGWRDYQGGRLLWYVEWNCFWKECPQDEYLKACALTKLFYKMHDTQKVEEFEELKNIYKEALYCAYDCVVKPIFVRGQDMSKSICEYRGVEEKINSGDHSIYNLYYIHEYLYECIYNGNIDDYIGHVEKHNKLYRDKYGGEWTHDDSKENLERYRARDADYFMNKYINVQKENAEEAARLLMIDKEEFPYIPPLKELKI